MASPLTIKSFQPLALHLRGVGPFQEGTETIRFIDKSGSPANFFLIVGPNGQGKTTALESFVYLLGLLTARPFESPAPEWLRSSRDTAIQLDLLIEVSTREHPALVSLVAGTSIDAQIKRWAPSELEPFGITESDSYLWGYNVSPENRVGQRSESDFLTQIATFIDEAKDRPTAAYGDELGQPTETAPTAIYFTADRDLARPAPAADRSITRPSGWTHQLIHRFDYERPIWIGSIDQLIVWLYWLDGSKGRFKSAQEILNRTVFKGTNKYLAEIQKDPPQACVKNGTSSHRLDQLSSGERSLVQLFLRIAVHVTQSSVVIVDELELHLHPAWARAALLAFKELVRSTPGMILIFTTHSKDVLERFDVHFEESGLRKGGHLFNMNRFDAEHESQETP